ncbi:hypothetical protein AN639_01940 [Candidatus Epulonipiscium fishelsonii]|uniref:Uncharacterized protein n=1 Tax=Candidatus Epulonipiscium fishelsonii TaxID=77094 RepID=A0ACC8X8P0_9FIRM|nr:hypothetical protein AN396_10900 [Epulopiscium sp. SCG-B11WGA-EpuloA1]ONI38965.1 hypothetical protein AN639_01940 [Epulopiscium sp. SCG-B05WGA-EpuloA1]
MAINYIKTILFAVVLFLVIVFQTDFIINMTVHHFDKAEMAMEALIENDIVTIDKKSIILNPNTINNANFYTDLGEVNTSYLIKKIEGEMYLSRDGSKVKPILEDTKVYLPGKYFLTYIIDDKTNVVSFEILGNVNKYWVVKTEQDIEEALKMAFENFLPEITLNLQKKYTDVNILNQEIFAIAEGLIYKYPKLVFEGYQLTATMSNNTLIKLELDYPDMEHLSYYEKTWGEIYSSLPNKLFSTDMKNYEREYEIYKYLIEHIQYDFSEVLPDITHTLYGAMNGIAVCDGYSKLMMYICNSVGIPTEIISGTADDIPHAWNKIEIDGNSYHLDVTWADQDSKTIGTYLDYFNETDEYMAKTHVWEKEKYPASIYTEAQLLNLDIPLDGIYYIEFIDEISPVMDEVLETNQTEISLIIKNINDEEVLIDTISEQIKKSFTYQLIDKVGYQVVSISL